MKKRLLFILLLFCCVFPALASDKPYPPPMGIRPVNSKALRDLIISFVKSHPSILEFVGGEDFAEQIPYSLKYSYPKLLATITLSSTPNNPYIEMGPWKMFYGGRPNERIVDRVKFNRPHTIVYRQLRYPDEGKQTVVVKTLVIDIRNLKSLDGNGRGVDEDAMPVNGWYLEEYTGRDLGKSIDADHVSFLAAGGRYSHLKWLESGPVNMMIVEIKHPVFSVDENVLSGSEEVRAYTERSEGTCRAEGVVEQKGRAEGGRAEGVGRAERSAEGVKP